LKRGGVHGGVGYAIGKVILRKEGHSSKRPCRIPGKETTVGAEDRLKRKKKKRRIIRTKKSSNGKKEFSLTVEGMEQGKDRERDQRVPSAASGWQGVFGNERKLGAGG